MPVIVYVSPDGARAASAGVWIVAGRGRARDGADDEHRLVDADRLERRRTSARDLRRKVINDAAASLTALAAAHTRNTTWPARAVRKASNLTAQQALNMHVIDVIAPTLPALLVKLDGVKTKDAERPFVLHLAGAQIDTAKPGFFTRLLNTLIDPNIITLLFLAGIIGIGFEIFHPGVVLPGALGGVALLTALFGFSVLPISWAGLALILLGVALLVIDAHVVTHGALTISGLISLTVGHAPALPQRARALPHLGVADARRHDPARPLLGVRAHESRAGAAAAAGGRAEPRGRRRGGRAHPGPGARGRRALAGAPGRRERSRPRRPRSGRSGRRAELTVR